MLQPHKQMDSYIGWVDTTGVVRLYDAMSDSTTQPADDVTRGGKNDAFDVTGSEAGGRTKISFSRLLSTGDARRTMEHHRTLLAHPPSDQ